MIVAIAFGFQFERLNNMDGFLLTYHDLNFIMIFGFKNINIWIFILCVIIFLPLL